MNRLNQAGITFVALLFSSFSAFAQDLPALLSQFQSEHDRTIKEATLFSITTKYPQAGPALLKIASETQDIDTKWLVIRGIGWLKYKEAEPFLKQSLSSDNEYVRANSACALGEVRDISAASDLIRTLKQEENSGVIEQTAAALRGIGASEAVPVLKTTLKRTRSAQTRAWVFGAISTLDSDDKDIPFFAAFLFDQNEIMAADAVHAIERFTGQDFGIPHTAQCPCTFSDGIKRAQRWWENHEADLDSRRK